MGFQTARQINNKLKEPNRMKKDPLTQMSINSFFTASSIKREPEDNVDNNENEVNNAQQAKRRKVEIEPVRVKDEPMDTTDDGTLNVKGEPVDYNSDGGTEKGSDDEMDTETQNNSNNAGSKSTKSTTNQNADYVDNGTQNPTNEWQNVKMERDSDGDTDEDSENEGVDRTISGVNQVNASQPTKKHKKRQSQVVQHVAEYRPNFESRPIEQQRIRTDPIVEDEPMIMVVAEPVRVEENIRNELDDDPVIEDQETDDEFQYSESNRSRRHRNVERQVKSTRQSTQGDRNSFQSDQRYQQPSISNSIYQQQQQQPSTLSTNYQQPSTSNSYYKSFPSTSSQNEAYDSSFSNYSQREQPFYNVGLESTRQATVDGHRLLRFNQFNQIEEQPIEHHDEEDDDVIDLDDLGDEIEKHQSNLEEQNERDIAKLKEIKMETLDPTGLKELNKRLEELMRKKQKYLNEKISVEAKKSEKQKEEMRDQFLLNLFGLNFNISKLDELIGTPEQTEQSERSSSRRDSSSEATEEDEKKKKMKYDEFMNKPIFKSEHQKPMKQHRAILAMNDHVKRMQDENKLDTVPQRVIDKIKVEKTAIKKMVDRHLMPYFKNGSINEKTYKIICEKITHYHFEYNDFGEYLI